MASESSDKKACYMDCVLRIQTVPRWEKSLTKILSSFEDLNYAIDPNQGFARIRGKIDPQLVLTKLKKGGKHVRIDWITYGPQREEKDNQSHALETYRNNLHGTYNPYNYYLYNNLNGDFGYPNYDNDHLGHKSSCHKCKKYLGRNSIPCRERRRSDYSRHYHSPEHHQHHTEEESSSQTTKGPSPTRQPTSSQRFHQGHYQGTNLRTAIKTMKKFTKKLFSSSKDLLGTCSNHASNKMLCFKK